MHDKMRTPGSVTRTDNKLVIELITALANIWFHALVLAVLITGIALLIADGVATLWTWPALLGVPLLAWWFGTFYGRYSQDQKRSNLF